MISWSEEQLTGLDLGGIHNEDENGASHCVH
jgi:hypothetical protein